jgi:hypothetical protein
MRWTTYVIDDGDLQRGFHHPPERTPSARTDVRCSSIFAAVHQQQHQLHDSVYLYPEFQYKINIWISIY